MPKLNPCVNFVNNPFKMIYLFQRSSSIEGGKAFVTTLTWKLVFAVKSLDLNQAFDHLLGMKTRMKSSSR